MSDTNVTMEINETETADEISMSKPDLITFLNLLQISAQEIIENASKKDTYSLQTNDRLYKDITYSTLKKELLKVKNVSTKLDLMSIFLKIKSIQKNKTNTLYKNILISDFQTNYKKKFTNVTPSFSAIKLQSGQKNNVSIDSVFIDSTNKNNFIVNVVVKNQGEAKKNIPIKSVTFFIKSKASSEGKKKLPASGWE